jgi:hypothetical protein
MRLWFRILSLLVPTLASAQDLCASFTTSKVWIEVRDRVGTPTSRDRTEFWDYDDNFLHFLRQRQTLQGKFVILIGWKSKRTQEEAEVKWIKQSQELVRLSSLYETLSPDQKSFFKNPKAPPKTVEESFWYSDTSFGNRNEVRLRDGQPVSLRLSKFLLPNMHSSGWLLCHEKLGCHCEN